MPLKKWHGFLLESDAQTRASRSCSRKQRVVDDLVDEPARRAQALRVLAEDLGVDEAQDVDREFFPSISATSWRSGARIARCAFRRSSSPIGSLARFASARSRAGPGRRRAPPLLGLLLGGMRCKWSWRRFST